MAACNCSGACRRTGRCGGSPDHVFAQAMQDAYANLLRNSQPLDDDLARILYANLSTLLKAGVTK